MNELVHSPANLRNSTTPRESIEIVPSPARPSLYDFSAVIQTEIGVWTTAMEAIAADPNAVRSLVRANKHLPGWSRGTLYRKFAAWKKDRDWTVLLDKRHWADLWNRSERTAVLPAEFIQFVSGKMIGNQKASAPPYRAILRQWQRWASGDDSERIPGYDVCPRVGPTGKHPVGWSEKNLMRAARSPKVQQVIARQGTVAAKALLPCVLGTRTGARWLEYVFFDDVQKDQKIIVPGYLQPVRPLQLGSLDYASACYLVFGQRPELPGKDGHDENLKRKDFLMVVAALIAKYGYPADYVMHLIVERGTATMSRAEARVLYDISSGHIIVCYTEMNGQLVACWDEGMSGNSSAKGSIESWHHLFHNEYGSALGQMGKDREHCPAALVGMEREAIALGKASAMLSPELRAQLRLPFPSPEECYFDTMEIIQRTNDRRDHHIEGFGKVTQWRPRGAAQWHDEWELASVNPAIMDMLEFQSRLESPSERRARLSHGVKMIRPPSNIWPRFYEDSHALKLTNPRGQIEVTLDGKKITFGPATPDGRLPDNTEVLAYFNPNDPDEAYITVKGRYIATWPRQRRVARGDQEQLAESIRYKKSALNAAVAGVRTKLAEDILRQDTRMQANLDVLASAGLLNASHDVDAETPGAAALQEIGKRIAASRKATEEMNAEERAEALKDADSILTSQDYESPEIDSTPTGDQEAEDFLNAITH